MECDLIRDDKGDEKLCADGYLYTKKKVGGNVYRRYANRAGTATTPLDVSAIFVSPQFRVFAQAER